MARKVINTLAGLFALALCAWPSTAGATPSTQIWIPSTDTQPFGTVHLGVDNYTTVFKKIEDGGHALPVTMGVTVGAADTSVIGAEIGVDLREPTDDPLYLNAKLQIKEDSLFGFFPAVAVGGYDFGTKSGTTDYNIFYLEMAKTLAPVGRFAVGYYVGNDTLLRDASGNKENDGVLLSFDRVMAEINNKLWFGIDYMGGQNVYGSLNFGISWRFSPNISAILGYDVYNERKLAGEDTVTIQFDIDF
ncbi:MAG: hypothetical protein HY751_11255 [Nitrospinae bacterium]|nr:hypothetical protein [Nitrospinota bacterium]